MAIEWSVVFDYALREDEGQWRARLRALRYGEGPVWPTMEKDMATVGLGAEWKAGEASEGKTALGFLASLRGTLTLESLGMAAGKWMKYGLIAGVVSQAWIAGGSLVREHKVDGTVSAMRAEQAFLIEKGLAEHRRIGVLPDENMGNLSIEGRTAYLSVDHEVAGTSWDASAGTRVAGMLMHAVGLPSLVRDTYAISVGDPSTQAVLRKMPEYVYRHEDAHGRAAERGLSFGAPESWGGDAAKIAKAAIGGPEAVGPGAWRTSLLSVLWGEAFADARACLAAASHGPGALSSCAIAVHGFRIFMDKDAPDVYTALAIQGNNHSVDMASFIAGQFDESHVQALSAQGLDELSGKAADASVAWFLAREGPGLAFFEGDGKAWWMAAAKVAGVEPGAAASAWRELKKASLAEKPQSAFGDFEWVVEGLAFKASGLSKSSDKHWRFDGLGGNITLSAMGDPVPPLGKALPGDRSDSGASGETRADGKTPADAKSEGAAAGSQDKGAVPDEKHKTAYSLREAFASVAPEMRLAYFAAAAKTHADLVKRLGSEPKVRESEAERIVGWANSMEGISGSGAQIKRRSLGL
jgi:hypothetical protein